jgi:peptidoglycan hydrolase CwlO-like protein
MRYLILVLTLIAACSKEETPAKPAPATGTPKAPAAGPSVDAAKTALDKSIADLKALIEKKQADMNALLEKAKSDPMKALQYQQEADKLRKEIADLQTKLDAHMKEAAGQ